MSKHTPNYCPRCGWIGENPAREHVTGQMSSFGDCDYLLCPVCSRRENGYRRVAVEEAATCTCCGDSFPPDMLTDGGECDSCAGFCTSCDGTGIPAMGPIEGKCGRCNGTGLVPKQKEDLRW